MPVATLTSARDDGALVSCQMEALAKDGEGALWFFTGLRSDLAERVRAVNFSFADDVRSTYVSLSGRGEIDKDAQRIARLWCPLHPASFPDGAGSRHLALLKVVREKAEYWEAPNSRTVRPIALAASAMSGTPIGQTAHCALIDLASAPPVSVPAPR